MTDSTVFASNAQELLKNELAIGAGITILGGLIGFAYAFHKGTTTGVAGVEHDLAAAFEGAIVGLIIAIIAVLLYRGYFHAQSAKNLAGANKERQLQEYQQARLARLSALGKGATDLNVDQLRKVSSLGVVNLPAAVQSGAAPTVTPLAPTKT